MVDQTEWSSRHHVGIGQVVGDAVSGRSALPCAMRPRGVTAVSGSKSDGGEQLRLHIELQSASVPGHHLNVCAIRDPGAGRVVDCRTHAIELFHPAVWPPSRAVIQAAMAVRVLLDDQENLVVVEGQRQIQPPHPAERGVRPACGLGLADGPDPPRPVPAAHRGVGGDVKAVAVDVDPPLPVAKLGKAAGLQRHSAFRVHRMRVLQRGGKQAAPPQVNRDALGFGNGQVQFLQGFDDVEPVSVDVLVEPVVVDRVAESDGGLDVATSDEQVGVFDTQSGVIADPGQRHETPVAVKHIEVRAVVEVAIRGVRGADRHRCLVDGVLVERTQDQQTLQITIRCELYWNYENRSTRR